MTGTISFATVVGIALAATCFSLLASAGADGHWWPTPTQRIILKMSRADTLSALAGIARSTTDGASCRGMSYRRLGLVPEDGELYYIVRCSSGDKFSIRIKRDVGGSTGVMHCGLLKVIAKVDCDQLQPSKFINPFSR